MTEAGGSIANEWDSTAYDDGPAFVFEHGRGVVDLLDVQPGERILDLGCGTGHLTDEIVEAGADVVGLDNSEEMIETARETYPDGQFVRADARDFSFEEPFDAVFSNAALRWIPEQDAVLESVTDALEPGGRFVAELGGTDNVNTIIDAVQTAAAERGYDIENPWFPERRRVRDETRIPRVRGTVRGAVRSPDRTREWGEGTEIVSRTVRR